LRDHVLDRGLDWGGLDRVDASWERSVSGYFEESEERTPCETQETVAGSLEELVRQLLGELDGLVLDADATDLDGVRTTLASA